MNRHFGTHTRSGNSGRLRTLLACALGVFACASSSARAMSTLGDVPEGLIDLAAPATIRNVQSGRDGEWVTLEAT